MQLVLMVVGAALIVLMMLDIAWTTLAVSAALGSERGCQQLGQVLLDLTSPVATMAQQHLAFPELRYLQAVERSAAVEPNIVVLDEAVTILRVSATDCVGEAVLRPLRSALDDLLERVPLQRLPEQAPPIPDLSTLSPAAPPVADPSGLQQAFAEERDRRRRLLALLRQAGWDWEAVEG